VWIAEGVDRRSGVHLNAYLNNVVRSRGNLTIWSKVPAQRILFDTSGTPAATGVEFRDNETGMVNCVFAHKEVILSAGAINSCGFSSRRTPRSLIAVCRESTRDVCDLVVLTACRKRAILSVHCIAMGTKYKGFPQAIGLPTGGHSWL
jgi:hypothetical protein